MGLFENVKNYVTGGAADVIVLISNPVMTEGESLKLAITVRPTGDTLHIKKIYLQVRAQEMSSVTHILYDQEYTIDEEIQINAGDEREWTYEVELPADVPATYIGRHFRMHWAVKAGLEMSGVDPNSGWQPFVLNKIMQYA